MRNKRGLNLEVEKFTGVQLSEKAVHAPILGALEETSRKFPPVMKEHLSRFKGSELYWDTCGLMNVTPPSRGAASYISVSLRNRIRDCELQ